MRGLSLFLLSLLTAFLFSSASSAAENGQPFYLDYGHSKGDKFISWYSGARVDLKESKEFIRPGAGVIFNPEFGIYASKDMFLSFGIDYTQYFVKNSSSTLQIIASACAVIPVGQRLNYMPGFGMSAGCMNASGRNFFIFTTFLDCASFEYKFNTRWALLFNCMRFQYAMTDVKDYGDTSGTGIDLNFSLSVSVGFRYFLKQ